MPFYSYHCDRCDKMHDGYRHISECHNGPICCEQVTKLVIVAPQVMPDLPGYESPTTGKWIEGRKARTEDLRRSGCRPYEPGEREDYERQKKYDEKRYGEVVHEATARAFYSLPESKRRALKN